jgi:hypothetical protein
MLRRSIAASTLVILAACQDYNFNPVGKCVIQPGASRIQLSSLSTADILFVVDDSGSMAPEQDSLARNFTSFIDALARTEAQRAQTGLQPLEFHIAITTSAIFDGEQPSGAPACASAPGGALQCNISSPTFSWTTPYTYACTQQGAPCPDLIQNYTFPIPADQCIAGVGKDHSPYPAGSFVAASGNPRVLHFTKDLNWVTWGTPSVDPKLTTLVQQFQQNIAVGTCGSGMEQHLEAGRLAVQKALDGKQELQKDEWPHAGAKLVVAWVGDEDDCSNPNDPTKALFFTGGGPGNDVCTADEELPPAKRKMFPVQSYADYFTSLGRPFSAAFIYSAINCRPDGNGNTVCDASVCNPGAGSSAPVPCLEQKENFSSCIGKSNGTRFHDLSAALRAKGVSTLDASVCDPNFAATLQGIADLVKPPPGLTLPTQPAAAEVSLLRIESADGASSRQCVGPAASAAAQAQSDWWFVDCKTGAPVFAGTTSCIVINHETKHCEANPGETYIAQYLGLVPPPDPQATSEARRLGGCAAASECSAALGGTEKDWTCAIGAGATRGTCVCSGG